MKVQTKIQKWGNGLAIRISGIVRDIPHFEEGMPIEIEVLENGLDIRKLQSKKRLSLAFTESELLEGMTPKTAHADLIANLLKSEY